MSFIRNQAVTGLTDTSYRMRVSDGKRWATQQLELQGELVRKMVNLQEEILRKLE